MRVLQRDISKDLEGAVDRKKIEKGDLMVDDIASFTLSINQAITKADPAAARLFLKKMFSGSAPSN